MKKLVTIILALMLTAAAATGCADTSEKDKDRDSKIENDAETGGETVDEDEDGEKDIDDGEDEGEDTVDKEDGEEDGKEDENAGKDSDDEQPEVPELPAHGDTSEQKPSQGTSNGEKPSDKPVNKPSNDVPAVVVPEIPSETPSAPSEPEVPAETPAEPEKPAETPAEPETPNETPAETPSEATDISSKTAEEIIELILEHNAPQFMYGTMQIDSTDEFSFNRYTGLSSAENVLDAAVCEPMIGSQAYSMVVVKLADGTDVQATAETMKSNINPRKWVCVEADDIKVSGCGNVVMFIMISSDFAEDVTASSATEAFKTVCGGALDFEF